MDKIMPDLSIDERKAGIYAWLFICVYVLVFSYLCFLKYYSFSYQDFDLAIMDQVLWNMGHGPMENSILGTHIFGNHMHFVLFVLAPFYKLWPNALNLLFLQTLALGVSAWPLFLMARRAIGASWALLVCFLYLFYPALAYMNLFEFHPVAFSTFFLLYMLYFYQGQRFVPFVIFMFLSMLCQENIPLAIAAMGIYSLVLRRSSRWILIPLACGIIYFMACVFSFLPFFNKEKLQFLSLYSHLGKSYTEVFVNIFAQPLNTLKIIFQPHKIYFLLDLFGPLCLIPFLAPSALIPAIPFFLQHMLSMRANEVTIFFHYSAELIPFIFMAFILGLKRILKDIKYPVSKFLPFFFIFAALFMSVRLGPHFSFSKKTLLWQKDARDRIKEEFIRKVSPDTSVVTTFEFLPFLSHRKELYSFHHVYMGFYTMSKRPYELPDNVQCALIDFSDPLTFSNRGFFGPENYKNLERFLSRGWVMEDSLDSIVLFKKDKGQGLNSLWEVLKSAPAPEHEISYLVDGNIELLGYDMKFEGGKIKLDLYWHCLQQSQKDISLFFHLVDSEGKLVYETFIPICWRVYPTYAWKAGEYIRDTRFLPFGCMVEEKAASWKMGFFDFLSSDGIFVDKRDVLGRIDIS